MSDAETMRALIERVEQATGPDRELDAEIGRAQGWKVWSYDDNDHIHAQIARGYFQGPPSEHPDYIRGGGRVTWRYCIDTAGKPSVYGELPKWTASLDAAVSLVPSARSPEVSCWSAEEWSAPGVHAAHVRATAWVPGAPRCYAATPALALVAAALRARLAMGGGDE